MQPPALTTRSNRTDRDSYDMQNIIISIQLPAETEETVTSCDVPDSIAASAPARNRRTLGQEAPSPRLAATRRLDLDLSLCHTVAIKQTPTTTRELIEMTYAFGYTTLADLSTAQQM